MAIFLYSLPHLGYGRLATDVPLGAVDEPSHVLPNAVEISLDVCIMIPHG